MVRIIFFRTVALSSHIVSHNLELTGKSFHLITEVTIKMLYGYGCRGFVMEKCGSSG